MPAVLTRSRDVDPVARKLLFAAILSMGARTGKSRTRKYQSSSTLEHPRQLTLAQREKAVRDGLGDREDAVRAAAAQTVAAWFDLVSEADGVESPFDALVAFVKLFDVVSPEGVDVATDALKSLFLMRNATLDSVILDGNDAFALCSGTLADIVSTDAFWRSVTPESIFVARVFAEYCREHELHARLERASAPVVTALAFYLQESCNDLLDAIEELEDACMTADSHAEAAAPEEEEMERREDVVTERAFVVAEILRLTALSDFSDEIGRRKAFAVVRECNQLLLHLECTDG